MRTPFLLRAVVYGAVSASPAGLVSACGSFAVPTRTVRERDVGPDATRLTGALATNTFLGLRFDEHDLVPAGVARAAIADDVALVSVDAQRACFAMVQRTPLAIDAPLSAWTVVVDGEDAPIDHEDAPQYVDYDYTGQRTISTESIVTRHRSSETTFYVTEPAIFRVVERTAHFCGPAPAAGEAVTLAFQVLAGGETARSGYDGWQSYYRWEVRP